MKVAQIGMGYVGLVGAVHFALNDVEVICYDVDPKVVEAISNGTPKAGEFLGYLQANVSELVKRGKLKATSQMYPDLQRCDAYLVSVPTERKDEPYMKIVEDVVMELVETFVDQCPLIIIESTVTPGTSQQIIDKLAKYSFILGQHYRLAIAPRRDWFASADKSVANLKRVVGTPDEVTAYHATTVLGTVCHDLETTTLEVAELCKSVENAIFNVQIAFAEWLSQAYGHVNVNEVLRIATTHWRLTPLQLSGGIGGRCIPLAMKYLKEGLKEDHKDLYGEFITDVMEQDFWYRKAIANVTLDAVHTYMIEDDTHIHQAVDTIILGLGYRQDFKDIGCSPGISVYETLKSYFTEGVESRIHIFDPLFSSEEVDKLGYAWRNPCEGWNFLVITTPHTYFRDQFEDILNYGRKGGTVVDATGIWQKYKKDIEAKGIKYIRVGEADWI